MYKLNPIPGTIRRLSDCADIPESDDCQAYLDYKEWLKAGNTPEPADAPLLPTVRQKLAAIRDVRERILNRLAGIAFAAQIEGDTATVRGYLVARSGLLNITADCPADPAAIDVFIERKYSDIVQALPSTLISAFAEVDS